MILERNGKILKTHPLCKGLYNGLVCKLNPAQCTRIWSLHLEHCMPTSVIHVTMLPGSNLKQIDSA